eukprot:12135222-Alexandrium_andersonii.AAC.1
MNPGIADGHDLQGTRSLTKNITARPAGHACDERTRTASTASTGRSSHALRSLSQSREGGTAIFLSHARD